MWCHLCAVDYPTFEEFRIHIIENHRKVSNLREENSDEEFVHENSGASDIDDENAALDRNAETSDIDDPLNTYEEENCYESDHNIDTEIKSEDSMDADVPGKYSNLDHTIAENRKSNLSMAALKNLLGKSHDDEAEPPVIKSNKKNKSGIKATASSKPPKKLKMSSVLKKGGRKKQMKVSFNRKTLPKRRKPACSDQEDIPEDSDGHSESLLNGGEVKSQSVPNNFINPPSVIPVNSYPQTIANNNPLYIVNPFGGQGMNNYILGNQAVQPPVYVVNPVATQSTLSNTPIRFDFNSQNILNWLTKHKELCKNIRYPLPPSLADRVVKVHKTIFDQYYMASISEERAAVMKVYEELDCMIHKQVNSKNNALNIV